MYDGYLIFQMLGVVGLDCNLHSFVSSGNTNIYIHV
jgi:hypothetical protein